MLKDKDIREPLFMFLEETFGKIRIIEEKTMGHSRADVVMVTENALYGIEIKSDPDTYVRLESQIKDYDSFFEFNMIAVGASHAAHVEEHVPEHWGIITVDEVDGKPDFYLLRSAALNPRAKRYFEAMLKRELSFLWRPELNHLLELNEMPRYPGQSKKFVRDKLVEKVEGEKLLNQLCTELFERDYELALKQIKEYKEAHGRKLSKTVKKRKRRKKTQ